MLARRLSTLLGTAALVLLGAATPVQAYDADVVVPTISPLPPVLVYSASQDLLYGAARYKCTNTAKMESYILVTFHQGPTPFSPDYVIGGKDAVPMVATCTGRWVTQILKVHRNSMALPTTPYPTWGRAQLSFTIEQQSIPSQGGIYFAQGPGATVNRSVTVIKVR